METSDEHPTLLADFVGEIFQTSTVPLLQFDGELGPSPDLQPMLKCSCCGLQSAIADSKLNQAFGGTFSSKDIVLEHVQDQRVASCEVCRLVVAAAAEWIDDHPDINIKPWKLDSADYSGYDGTWLRFHIEISMGRCEINVVLMEFDADLQIFRNEGQC